MAFDQRWCRAFSFRSRSYLALQDERARREGSVKQYMPVHISSRSYSTLGCVHAWQMAYGIWQIAWEMQAHLVSFFHPPNNTDTQTHTIVIGYQGEHTHIRYAQTLTVFVLRTQQICIQSRQKEREIEK
ncbi:hypothetical protein MVEG_11988 [Podila verticillata NRRL 6337]|uniref:Uncharacterized protein n=1 Tax=Podila verticillata NRRL 6337 TaxID=1069443 RepID=A0A086TKW9_9FUNG|nr:hypothetical protein MVEG_11988 [Podila verticillata NRRL 6337]